MSERIYDARHDYDSDHVMHVDGKPEVERLRLDVVDGEELASIELSGTGVRALRLALQRWERAHS